MKLTVSRFLERHSINPSIELNDVLISGIDILERVNNAVDSHIVTNIDRLQDIPAWSVIHDMYKKCYEFTSGAAGIFLIAHIASAEALCRTSIEASVNLYYASYGDDLGNVLGYFKHYISTERSQNSLWLKSLEASSWPIEAKIHHRKLIQEKNQALDRYEEILAGSLSIIGIDFRSRAGSWPNAFDRFKKIGKEVEYRTIYAALCSQAHNDPEDILNNLVSRVVLQDGIEQSVQIEQYVFSLNMLLTSISWFTEASAIYVAKYEISVVDTILPIFSESIVLLEQFEHASKEHIRRPFLGA